MRKSAHNVHIGNLRAIRLEKKNGKKGLAGHTSALCATSSSDQESFRRSSLKFTPTCQTLSLQVETSEYSQPSPQITPTPPNPRLALTRNPFPNQKNHSRTSPTPERQTKEHRPNWRAPLQAPLVRATRASRTQSLCTSPPSDRNRGLARCRSRHTGTQAQRHRGGSKSARSAVVRGPW